MKTKKITLISFSFLLSILSLQAQKVLEDWNGYVDSKNKSTTGYINLVVGSEEKAAQTYHYSGPGRVSSVMVYGNNPGLFSVPLRVSLFTVDSKGRPVSEIKGANADFNFWNSSVQANFSGGVNVSSSFAVVVAIRTNAFPGQSFQVKYTGNGEGNGQDLASIAGTTTGNNWASALSAFSKDGDLYLVPKMSHDITAGFTTSTKCATTSTNISFTNTSKFTKDSMFNKIAWSGYTGGTTYYSWTFGDGGSSTSVNPSHTYTTAGSYTAKLVTAVVGWNSTKYDTFSMKISVGLGVSATAVTNLSCFNNFSGSVVASGLGGTAPYTYSLTGNDYQSSPNFSALSAGTYSLYIEDALGCKASTTFTITQPTAVTFSSVGTTGATCNGNDGAILVVGTGGVGALQYKLDAGAFQNNGSFSSLSWGSYLVTVKDANGCSHSATAFVSNTSAPVLTVSNNNVSCFGGNDGSITMSSTGGTGAVQYSIDGGKTFQSSGSFTGLKADTFSAMVKDAAGCAQGKVIIITEPNKINFAVTSKPATCFGKTNGEIQISSAIGGIGKLTYSINGTNYQSSPDFTGLAAGNYTAYVKDVASCLVTKTVVVTQPTKINTSKAVFDAVCNGSNTGSIIVSPTGGTPAYTFSFDGGVNYQATGYFNGVGAGNYNILVKDNNSCIDTVKVTVAEPTLIVPSVSTTNSTCGNPNGSMLVTATGGTGTYTYSLDGTTWVNPGQFTGKKAGTYLVAVKDAAGCIVVASATIMDSDGPVFGSISKTGVTCNGGSDGSITINSVTGGTGLIEYSLDGLNWQTSNQFKGLKAGSYVVIVKDANGCRSNSSVVGISQPNAIVITKSIVNVNCFGSNNGSVTITASGGAGTLAYSLDGGVSFQSDKTFNQLYAGTYTAIVRDAGGCSNGITFTITQPTEITSNVGILDVTCYGASDAQLTINATGGKAPYTYSIGAGYQSLNTFTGLGGGNLAYYVKDANGCAVSKLIYITEPEGLAINSVTSNVSCAGGNNGVINLTVNGGTKPYGYTWSNNASTEDIFNLKAGSYSVKVNDANGCTKNANFTVTQPASPLVVNGVVANGTNGSIDITVTGGVLPYTFLWSNAKTTEDISGLSPGNYTVTITDANGCITTSTFTVYNSTGITQQTLNNELKMFPNPSTDKVTIELSNYNINNVRILNNVGKVVYESTPEAKSIVINTSVLIPGFYFVQIESEGVKTVQKLLVNR